VITLAGARLSPATVADSVEAELLFGATVTISKAELGDWLEEDGTQSDLESYDAAIVDAELGDERPDTTRSVLRSRAAEGVSAESGLAEDALLELQRRAEIVGEKYPIEISGSRAQRTVDTWKEAPVYAFLVALNVRHASAIDGDFRTAARLFERLVVFALRQHWCGEAAHFGFPRDPTEEAGFPRAFEALVARLGERLNVRVDDLPSRLKDLEVDAVAWKPLDDRRGQTVLLCQCAIGDDWEAKGIHLDQWEKVVTFAVKPYKAVAFPFVPEATRDYTDVEWELLCGKAGLPLDRIRLAQLLAGQVLDEELRRGMVAWVESIEAVLSSAA
jgi:hypothetical protein